MTRAEKLALISDDSIREITLSKGSDTMSVKVTEDGRYRAEVVGSVSSINHGNADTFLREIATFLGGVLKITKRGAAGHTHTHAAGHTHTH